MELESKYWQARNELLALSGSDTVTVDSTLRSVFDGMTMIPAKVVSNTIDRHDNLLTIDQGSADGVKPDMGVVCGMGLVGVVYMVGTHYAIVMPLLNSHSRISCAIRSCGYFGYLQWDGKNPTEAYMEDVPRHACLRKRDQNTAAILLHLLPLGTGCGQHHQHRQLRRRPVIQAHHQALDRLRLPARRLHRHRQGVQRATAAHHGRPRLHGTHELTT